MREYNGKKYIEETPHDIAELLEVVRILRSPDGCEWDRAQTFDTMIKCVTDETEEVVAARKNKDYDNLCDELGDLLLQVIMNAQIASEQELFTFEDVVQILTEKLIRRHPHVFGDVKKPTTPEDSIALWRSVKEKEKAIKIKKKN